MSGEPRRTLPVVPDFVIWLGVCIIIVALRGVQWDETYENARVLIGAVRYPEGHPLPAYLHRAFSVQLYVSAALVWLTNSPLVVNGFRNTLCLLTIVLPVYLLVRDGAGSRCYGLAAVALVLAGVLAPFRGSYFLATWPGLFSNGPIGCGVALITVWALCTGRTGAAAFLAAALPAIHIGQAPPVLLLLAVALGVAWVTDRQRALRMAAGFGLGAAFTLSAGVIAVLIARSAPPIPHTAGWESIWQCFTFVHDTHRRSLPINAYLVSAQAAGLCGIAVCSSYRKAGMALHWLGVYVAGVIAIVFAIWFVHQRVGMALPYWAIGWMPYRLTNHLPYVSLAVGISLLAPLPRNRGVWLLAPVVLATALVPPLAPSMGHWMASHFRDSGFGLFLLAGMGAGCACGWRENSAARRASLGLIAFVTLVALPAWWGFHGGATWTILGMGSGVAAARLPLRPAEKNASVLLGAVAVCVLIVAVAGEAFHRAHLPRTAAEQAFATYLGEHAAPGAVVAAPPYKGSLQEKLGRPMLEETSTAALMSYVPTLAPSIQRIYLDFYGIDYRLESAAVPQGDWQPVWRERETAEWARLGERYGVAYIVAPDDVPLQLTPVVHAEAMTLYEVP